MAIGRLLRVEGPADRRGGGSCPETPKNRKASGPLSLEEGGRKPGLGVSKAPTMVAKEIGFSSVIGMGFCCQHAVAFGSQPLSNFLPVHPSSKWLWGTYCVLAFPLESPKQPHKANASEGTCCLSRSGPGNAKPPGGALNPRTGPASRGGRPLRLQGRSGRRRGSRRRLCDFGFDLPGDELIPLYNRLRGDRTIAARNLRRHRDHRPRAGRGPGKIQPLWRRVSLTAGTSGGGLGCVAPAARPWPRGPRASTRTPGLSQTPQSLARCRSPALPDRAYSHLILTANVQPRVCTTQAQSRPEKKKKKKLFLSGRINLPT